MNVESLRQYCRSKPGRVTEEFPFNEETVVFKINGKMFLLMNIDDTPPSINVKCDPARASELRERYPAVQPGYHMNKKHWNTVMVDGSIPRREILDMIDHSFELVSGPHGTRTQKATKRR